MHESSISNKKQKGSTQECKKSLQQDQNNAEMKYITELVEVSLYKEDGINHTIRGTVLQTSLKGVRV